MNPADYILNLSDASSDSFNAQSDALRNDTSCKKEGDSFGASDFSKFFDPTTTQIASTENDELVEFGIVRKTVGCLAMVAGMTGVPLLFSALVCVIMDGKRLLIGQITDNWGTPDDPLYTVQLVKGVAPHCEEKCYAYKASVQKAEICSEDSASDNLHCDNNDLNDNM